MAFLFQKITLLMLFMCQYVPVSLYFFIFFLNKQPLYFCPQPFPFKAERKAAVMPYDQRAAARAAALCCAAAVISALLNSKTPPPPKKMKKINK